MKQKILLVSDADTPQVNGVVRNVQDTIAFLRSRGKEVLLISPQNFQKKIMLSKADRVEWVLTPFEYKNFVQLVENFSPDCIHIVTEGSVGKMARKWCRKNNFPFTTSYHTMWAEYFFRRYKIPKILSEKVLQQFHTYSKKIFTPSPFIQKYLQEKKFLSSAQDIKIIPNGVDTNVFYPRKKTDFSGKFLEKFSHLFSSKKPILLFVGRIAPEKNLEAFLSLDIDATKVLVGDGPLKNFLEKKYPESVFLGEKFGDELAQMYSLADVFVFPSKTDTFGIVLLEALACGIPVAGFVMPGSQFILSKVEGGIFLEENFIFAVEKAIGYSQDNSLEASAEKSMIQKNLQKFFSLEAVGEKFLEELVLK
jgi:glycosyltransferase involved in cell wall biosynthesis